uniref:CSON002748 protein n=1 Tax=Culicoides sonorensis TaxID=179676 RepID=A0A336MNF0_CULSO
MSYLINRNLLRCLINRTGFHHKPSISSVTFERSFASKSSDSKEPAKSPEENNKPVDFLQSPAASWKASYSTVGIKDEAPWQESWSVLLSVTIFMIYFCILREENDIDQKIEQPLYDTVPGLEQQNLIAMHKYNLENGKDNRGIEKRMREIGMDVEGIRKIHFQ